MTKSKSLLSVLLALFLVAAACGDSSDSEGSTGTTAAAESSETTAAEETDTAETTEAMADEGAMPGSGVTVTMARADWSTGYFQAYVYQQLLEELGYEVTDPAELELGPSLAYLSMAQGGGTPAGGSGDFDFWVNSWYPGHTSWWAPELPDGTTVGDHIAVVGEEMIAGGLQGFLMTKSFADEYGITTMDELNSNAEALAAFDAADPTPGNGIADIYGCQESWTCDNIITSQIAFSGWENIQQTIAGYDAMVAEATDKANSGEPMVVYTWTPSAYITALIPGDNVVWLGVDAVLDDSNPLGEEGGDAYDQRPGTAAISPEQCPMAADAGTCQVGWSVADIQVTANSEFLAANPAAAALLEQVKLSVIDVSLANVEQSNGKDTNDAIQQLAADWIANNRDVVDGWISAAAAAG